MGSLPLDFGQRHGSFLPPNQLAGGWSQGSGRGRRCFRCPRLQDTACTVGLRVSHVERECQIEETVCYVCWLCYTTAGQVAGTRFYYFRKNPLMTSTYRVLAFDTRFCLWHGDFPAWRYARVLYTCSMLRQIRCGLKLPVFLQSKRGTKSGLCARGLYIYMPAPQARSKLQA